MTNTVQREPRFLRRDILIGTAGVLAAQACRAPGPSRSPALTMARSGIDMEQFVEDCAAASEGRASRSRP